MIGGFFIEHVQVINKGNVLDLASFNYTAKGINDRKKNKYQDGKKGADKKESAFVLACIVTGMQNANGGQPQDFTFNSALENNYNDILKQQDFDNYKVQENGFWFNPKDGKVTVTTQRSMPVGIMGKD